jgi:aspartate/methionine/tyrosine aminotransferase
MPLTEPWSKKHKRVTRAGSGGLRYSLSNSFAQPTSCQELLQLTKDRGDRALLQAYFNHELTYTPNGGSLDLREAVAGLYGELITADHVLIFPGCQVALQTAAMALAGSKDHAIVFSPAYQSTAESPLHAGCPTTTLPLSAAAGWQIDLAAVEAAIRPNTRYIVVNQVRFRLSIHIPNP